MRGRSTVRPDRVAVAAFVGFVVISGAAPVAVRLGGLELPPLWAAGFRYAIAAVLLTALALVWRVPFPRGAQLLGPVLFGLIFFGISVPLYYVGQISAPAAVGSLSGAFSPLATLAIASVIGLERFTLRAL